MSLEVTVVCDGCSAILSGAFTGAKARAEAKAQGAKVALPGGRDLCAECAERES